MGLDNGVIVRGVTRKDLPRFLRYPTSEDYSDKYVEVCYWRKCWGLRNLFLEDADINPDFGDVGEYPLGDYELTILIRCIDHYLRNPDEWKNSIWTYDEIRPVLREQKWNLVLLRGWLWRHPDAEIFFYDSY